MSIAHGPSVHLLIFRELRNLYKGLNQHPQRQQDDCCKKTKAFFEIRFQTKLWFIFNHRENKERLNESNFNGELSRRPTRPVWPVAAIDILLLEIQ